MGNKYDNITVHGPTQAEIIAALEKSQRRAFVSPTVNGFTVVFEADKHHLQDGIAVVPLELSQNLKCAVLDAGNFDDDVLSYTLFVNGRVVDAYQSNGIFQAEAEYEEAMEAFYESDDPDAEMPDEVDEVEARKPRGGNAQELCETLGAPEVQERVRTLLHVAQFTFEVWRHMELAELLKMPNYAVSCDYQDVLEGNLPEDLSLSDLQRAGPCDA